MKSLFFFIALFLCFSIVTPSYAQDNVPVRIGKRDGYARITFGWLEKTDYALEKHSAAKEYYRLSIKFNRDANIDLSGIDFSALNNIASMQLVSASPLEVSFLAPKSSNIRDFRIGKRVVIDVYDPTDKDDFGSFSKLFNKTKPNKKTANHSQVSKLPLPKQKPAHVKLAVAAPPASVTSPEKLSTIPHENHSPKNSDAIRKNVSKAVKDIHHVISVRSTSNVQFAAYENLGSICMAIGDGSPYIIPRLNSPERKRFSRIERIESDSAHIFKMSLPDEPIPMKAKGGELIWDLILGDNVKEYTDSQPLQKEKSSDGGNRNVVFMPLKYAADIIDVKDDITGNLIKVVMVSNSSKYTINAQSFIDFDILRSPIGLALVPKVDDLELKKVSGGIEISRPEGLSISSSRDVSEARIFSNRYINDQHLSKYHNNANDEAPEPTNSSRDKENFFLFSEWKIGDIEELKRNENVILSSMIEKSKERRVEDLLSLGKMFLSHGYGAEALGYLNYALSELRDLNDSSEFRAIRGVSKALDWKSADALKDFLYKDLQKKDEIKYWTSYVLADLGDWQQAARVLPDHYRPIYDYPSNIGHRLSLVLAEVNLRDGNVKNAEELFALIKDHEADLTEPQKAAFKYLQGEALRQHGEIGKTEELWGSLSEDKDDLYRTKARLALTILQANNKKIDNLQSIDNLERLRYAWRGDELEAQVNFWLGDAYFKNDEYVKGLYIMRDAVSVAGDSNLGKRIAKKMSKIFSDLFLERKLKDISAVDAVTLYEQFRELTPIGSKGDKIVQILAEHLVEADLLGRASKLLWFQVNHRLKGQEKMRIAIRLAAIELLNKNPQKTIEALTKASSALKRISDKDEIKKRKLEIAMLRVRAYYQNEQFDKALILLKKIPQNKDVNRLRADITWRAGYWKEASYALDEVILDDQISMTHPLTIEQSDLILNRAIALSLGDDRIALANMRKKYSDLMLQTEKSHQFDVITRPMHGGSLADRETLLSIVSEVDLFKDFLDNYTTNYQGSEQNNSLGHN